MPKMRPSPKDISLKPWHLPGFTVVELLVVVAIIGSLIGIAIPLAAQARASANEMICKSNLRQLYAAVLEYSQDNRGLIPPAYVAPVTWSSALLDGKYLLGTEIAPGDIRNEALGCPQQRLVVGDRLMRTYSFNAHIGTGDRKFTTLVSPSRTLLIADGNYVAGRTPPYNISLVAGSILPTAAHPNEKGTINCLFGDGHVESRSNEDTDEGVPRGVGAPGSSRYLFWTGR